MAVFTVFFCGTSSNKFDVQHPDFPSGEIVSTLADHHQGTEFVDWIVVDGPGSGDHQNDEKWTKATTAGMNRQIVFGTGWEENVSHALAVIRCEYEWKRENLTEAEVKKLKGAGIDVEGKDGGSWFWRKVEYPRKATPQDLQLQKAKMMRKGALPTAVNVLGWSRGAVSAVMLANAMAKDSKLASIPVNVFAVDPVPGATNFQSHRTVLPANVKSYFAVYARDERSKVCKPIVPKTKGVKPTVLAMPGRHATVAGNGAIDGEKGAQQLPAPGKVVRHLAEQHLTQWGTKLGKTLNLSKADLLKLYQQMQADEKKYVALRAKVYSMGAEDKDGERLVALGEGAVATAFGEIKGKDYGNAAGLSAEDGFVNWHHRSLAT